MLADRRETLGLSPLQGDDRHDQDSLAHHRTDANPISRSVASGHGLRLDTATSLRKGRVVAHSKDRDEIHRALKHHAGHLCIHFTGRVPQDTVVVFPCLE